MPIHLLEKILDIITHNSKNRKEVRESLERSCVFNILAAIIPKLPKKKAAFLIQCLIKDASNKQGDTPTLLHKELEEDHKLSIEVRESFIKTLKDFVLSIDQYLNQQQKNSLMILLRR